jgi:MFS family permease
MFLYFLVLRYLDTICKKLGLKYTIILGLFIIFIAELMLPPIFIFPRSSVVIVIGLVLLGIPGALINIPALCDIIETLKLRYKYIDDASANDIASAIFNLSINMGEAIGPTLGGLITEFQDFGTSCVCISFIALGYCIFLYLVNFKSIKEYKSELKDDKVKDEYEEQLILKQSLL